MSNNPNNLKKIRDNKIKAQTNLNKRAVAAPYNNSRTANRSFFKNHGVDLLAELQKMIDDVKNKNKTLNYDRLNSDIDKIIKNIGEIRHQFAYKLEERLVDTLGARTGNFNVYKYYPVKNNNTPTDRISHSNALNVTTGIIKNYTGFLTWDYTENLTGSATRKWPAIMDMDGILLNYNKSALRIKLTQDVNRENLKREIKELNNKITSIETAKNTKLRNNIGSKLEKIKNSIESKKSNAGNMNAYFS